MKLRRPLVHAIAATLAVLSSLHCDGGEKNPATTTTSSTKASSKPQAQPASGPQVELVRVELTQLRPTSDLIVELVGAQVRLLTPNHTGQPLDFGRRAPDNEHLRVELLDEAKQRFADAVRSSERGEVRVRLDAKTPASDFVDLLYTMGRIGVLGYELEIATAEGPHVLPLNMPQTCHGEPSERRCVNLHLRVTEQGTLVSAMLMDPSTWCDIPPEDAGTLASISGHPLTPSDAGCPGWPHIGPGDVALDQLLTSLGKLGPLCRTSEVSVDNTATAATFIPTLAALRAANQHVVFRAGARTSCAGPLEPIAIDSLPSK